MILSGREIQRRMGKEIIIDPFNEKQLNPNSYNLRLHHELLVYDNKILDMKKPNPYQIITIPQEGMVMETGKLYLGRTMEYTKTEKCVPMLEGRSSVGRLGLFVHVTAGFGDIGFSGYWTLGNVLRTAYPHLSGRGNLPDLLSPDRRRLRPLCQQKVSV
jgi:dCTP deaminase